MIGGGRLYLRGDSGQSTFIEGLLIYGVRIGNLFT